MIAIFPRCLVYVQKIPQTANFTGKQLENAKSSVLPVKHG